uniref:Uncharacterized protein n=1 Tax=Picea glauca TaxID=3330 RepID=A0A117NGL5_PICGL|nr:hypothetical protein ABT39_MTgene5977 [Picea glauca]
MSWLSSQVLQLSALASFMTDQSNLLTPNPISEMSLHTDLTFPLSRWLVFHSYSSHSESSLTHMMDER